MRVLRAEASAASIPTEVMKLIVATAKIHLPNELAILGRIGIKINDAHGVVLSIRAIVEERDIRQALSRSLHCQDR
jgi:hypothetical protein